MTPTAIGTIFHLIPTARPLFTPRERALAGLANFYGEIRFFPLFDHRVWNLESGIWQFRDFII